MGSIGSFGGKQIEREGKILSAATAVTVGPVVAVLTATVPVDKIWRVHYAEVACRGYGRWSLYVGGTLVGGGLTSAANEHDRTDLPGYIAAPAASVVEVKYTYNHGPAGIPLDVFVGYTEV